MGLMNFLDKAFEKCVEYAPQVMEQVNKIQEKEEKKSDEYYREVEKYKKQYSFFSDNELLEELNRIRKDSTINSRKARNAACLSLFDERGFEIGSDNKVRRKTF